LFKFIDLFAGIGGMRLALESMGGQCVFSSEWDKFAQKTYFENFNEIPHGDITKINSNEIPNFDVMTAGFPCQPFSSIGKREGFNHPTQGTLFFDVQRIIKAKRPRAFILENVKGLVNHDNGKTLKVILDNLAISVNGEEVMFPVADTLNYHIYWKVMDSQYFNVPQTRKRIFIIGFDAKLYSIEKFTFPQPNIKSAVIAPFVEQNILGYSISRHLQEKYLFKKNDGKPQIISPSSLFPVKTLVSTYHKIQRLTGTFVNDPASETGLRLLSENECKAVMSFPKSYKIPVSRTQMYRQFGNSVAVEHVKKVAQKLHEIL
jgi:DNA (cytosine-5)-methyltransferase 1